MNYDYKQDDLSRGLLSGLFAGIVATFTNIAFVGIYRAITSFDEFNVLDITVIVFGSMLLSVVCGILFYFLVHTMKKSFAFYRIIILMVTVIIVYLGLTVRAEMFGTVPVEFRVLVIGTQIIIGMYAAFLIPYLFSHDKLIS